MTSSRSSDPVDPGRGGAGPACPVCAWPVAEPAYPVSSHPVSSYPASSRSVVDYVRCVCGVWLVVEAGRVVAAAGGPRSASVPCS
ncbi:hypothetical protein [Saccharothrix syringae]|uniref:Uncharacterized protein n=1 Tax=Saccharothrix syringae TaxID=103733 RepID=A0A5Q0H1C0_SACSY|nr:hypothetical protein [Saccharothrix syringae]QFZ20057.1 hypothetical protein EKG83_23885 [Saccharothrix syringae]